MMLLLSGAAGVSSRLQVTRCVAASDNDRGNVLAMAKTSRP
jgi:hypothetical protein